MIALVWITIAHNVHSLHDDEIVFDSAEYGHIHNDAHNDPELDHLLQAYEAVNLFQINNELEGDIPLDMIEEEVKSVLEQHGLYNRQVASIKQLLRLIGKSGETQYTTDLFIGDIIYVKFRDISPNKHSGRFATISKFVTREDGANALYTTIHDNVANWTGANYEVFHVNRCYARFKILGRGDKHECDEHGPRLVRIGFVIKSIKRGDLDCALVILDDDTVESVSGDHYWNDMERQPKYMSPIIHTTPTADDVYCFHTFSVYRGKIQAKSDPNAQYTVIKISDIEIAPAQGMYGTLCVNWPNDQYQVFTFIERGYALATSLNHCMESIDEELNKLFQHYTIEVESDYEKNK